jgi:hypothetical protein
MVMVLALSGLIITPSVNMTMEADAVTPVGWAQYPRVTIWYHLNNWNFTEITADFVEIKARGWDGLCLCPIDFMDVINDSTNVKAAIAIADGLGLKVILLAFGRMTVDPRWGIYNNSYLLGQDGSMIGGDFFNDSWIDGYLKNYLVQIDNYYGGLSGISGYWLDDTWEGIDSWISYNSHAKTKWATWLQDKYITLSNFKTNWRGKWANGTVAGATWYASWAAAGNDPPIQTTTNPYSRQDWFEARSDWFESFSARFVQYINTNHTHPVIIDSTLPKWEQSGVWCMGLNSTKVMKHFDGISPYIFGGGKIGGARTRVGYGSVGATGTAVAAAKMASAKIITPCIDLNAYDQVLPTLANLTDEILGVMATVPESSYFAFNAWVFNWSTHRMPVDHPDIWYNLPVLLHALLNGHAVGEPEIGVLMSRQNILLGSGGVIESIGIWQEAGFKTIPLFEEDFLNVSFLNQFKLIVLGYDSIYFNDTWYDTILSPTRTYWLFLDYPYANYNQTSVINNAASFRSRLHYGYVSITGWPFHYVYMKNASHPLADGLPNPFYMWWTPGQLSSINTTGSWEAVMNFSTSATYSCLLVNRSQRIVLSGLDLLGDNSTYSNINNYNSNYLQLAYNIGVLCGATPHRHYSLWDDGTSEVAIFNNNSQLGHTLSIPSSMRFIVAENSTGISISNSLGYDPSRVSVQRESDGASMPFSNVSGAFVMDLVVGTYHIIQAPAVPVASGGGGAGGGGSDEPAGSTCCSSVAVVALLALSPLIVMAGKTRRSKGGSR